MSKLHPIIESALAPFHPKPGHTPGPWKVEIETKTRFDENTGEKKTSTTHWIQTEKNITIALTSRGAGDVPAETNAHLISAAPEMYAILKSLHSEEREKFQAPDRPCELCRVLAKAEGRS